MAEFDERIALVTGANSGIGRAIALGLAERGATVCLVARDAAKLASAESIARKHSPSCFACASDLTDDGKLRDLAADVRSRYGRLDLLVHAAGIYSAHRLDSASLDKFDRLYQTNVRAPFALTQLMLPLIRCCRGQIVFVNSLAILKPKALISQYAATKHALKAIADSLREEVNADGIRVMSVYPGRTAGPLQEAIFRAEGKPYRPEQLLQPEDTASVVIHALGLPRTGEVTDLYVRPFAKS